MKFKFCSDGDCPLWALAGLHALSSLPALLFRTLLQQVIKEQPDDGIMEILKDTSLSSRDECARAAAVIRWVVQQALSCSCSGSQLTRDLLVLGVPRAHAAALAETVDAQSEPHQANVRSNGFMVNKISDVALSSGPDGTVDTCRLSLFTDDVFSGEHKKRDLLIERSQVRELLTELKKAYKRMEDLEAD
ncbi:COMM domain-containing protein 4 isoform X1 [Amyelois transitella]|uniref:COMM domain-containing protein 4 isoform X1 n=1 Tax=Amyelois transitella TaxID=680683 RepID=UPI00067E4F85|nr:COMM domain-containing protein 4 isoform X1 [Amyelois transitella]